VLQTVFSDGLAHVSVFIEAFDALRHRQGMRTTLGATSTVMHRRGDWWITVVGEVPMATVLQFDAALERRR
jgi:sigma-E factor negative regulatory protein RseB